MRTPYPDVICHYFLKEQQFTFMLLLEHFKPEGQAKISVDTLLSNINKKPIYSANRLESQCKQNQIIIFIP